MNNQGNEVKKEHDENIIPILEEKEPHRKKFSTGRLIFGILLVSVGVILGLGYLANVCFVSFSQPEARTATVTTTVEYCEPNAVSVAVPVPVAEVSHIATYALVTEDMEMAVTEGIIRETVSDDNKEIIIGDISVINVTSIDSDTIIKIGNVNENKLVISNDDSDDISFSLDGRVLKVYDNEVNSKAKIEITVSSVRDIFVNSRSGDIEVIANINMDVVLDNISLTSNSGETGIESVIATNAFLNSNSGELSIDQCLLDSIDCKTNSGDIDIYNTETINFSLETTSGDVRASMLRGNGNSVIKTTSGDIKLENIYADSLVSNSSSGSLEINDSELVMLTSYSSSGTKKISNTYCNKIISTSSSGSFVADRVTSQVINVNSSSGRASIDLIPIEDISIDIITSSGNVGLRIDSDIIIDLVGDKISKNELNLDNTSNNKVHIHTTSGIVKITR